MTSSLTSIEYGSMTTGALIELLFREEDRVTLDHVAELVQRGPEALPRLREILGHDDYWYEGQGGDFWIERHVVTILSRIGDVAVLPDLLDQLLTCWFADYGWLLNHWGEVLAGFGDAAVEPLIAFVGQYRGAFRDNSDYSDARAEVVRGLTLIAHRHPAVRERVLAFLLDLLVDEAEDDRDFLTRMVECPLFLNRERSQEAVRTAFRRGMIDAEQVGAFRDLLKSITPAARSEFFRPRLDQFYSPREIRLRQEVWASPDPHARVEELESAGASWIGSPSFPPPLAHFYPNSAVSSTLLTSSATGGSGAGNARVGRNDPCPCGSGKKYKKCCGQA